MEIPKELRPLVILGGGFTIRTFADNSFHQSPGTGWRANGHCVIDRVVTITLPAVSGEEHTIVPTVAVKLYPHGADRSEERIGARAARRKKAEEV